MGRKRNLEHHERVFNALEQLLQEGDDNAEGVRCSQLVERTGLFRQTVMTALRTMRDDGTVVEVREGAAVKFRLAGDEDEALPFDPSDLESASGVAIDFLYAAHATAGAAAVFLGKVGNRLRALDGAASGLEQVAA